MSKQLDTKAFDDFKAALDGVLAAFQQMLPAIAQLIIDILEYDIRLRELTWREYLEAGAPYGETDAGMMEWLKSLRDEKAQD